MKKKIHVMEGNCKCFCYEYILDAMYITIKVPCSQCSSPIHSTQVLSLEQTGLAGSVQSDASVSEQHSGCVQELFTHILQPVHVLSSTHPTMHSPFSQYSSAAQSEAVEHSALESINIAKSRPVWYLPTEWWGVL